MRDLPRFYYIDLAKTRPTVSRYSVNRLRNAMDDAGVKRPMDLRDDYDRPVFETREAADAFLKRYLKVLDALDNKKICKSRDLPAILYKRRYQVQTLMGLKNQTYREYKKPWKPGQLFNLHDQVYFVTVRLKSITDTADGWKYSFELP